MHYRIGVVIFFLLAIASCTLSADQEDFQCDSSLFDIDEGSLSKGILRICLPEEVPKNLAIQAPSGEWFVIQESEESIEAMPQEQFESVKLLEFQTDELEGVTWRESKKVTDIVFQKSGSYLIYFSDNLETEPSNTFSLQKSVDFEKSQ